MNKNNRETIILEALGDLRKCLEFAEEMGNVEFIDGADPHLEIGALYEISLEEPSPPVLVFRNIKGYPPGHRIAMNIRTSKVFDRGEEGLDLVQSYRKHRRKHTEPIPPVVVTEGPVLENVLEGNAVDVLAFPAPQWHEQDGGKYIGTECIVITRDPDSDWVNLGTYRVQVHDKNTLFVFIEHGKHGDVIRRKYWARGKHCPMVISVGQSPVLGAVGASTPGPNVSEYAVAGSRLGRPIEVIHGRHTGMPFPADSELVFEGFMPSPQELAVPEGPFGEWPGYYASNTRPEPVLQVKAIYHRNDPIVLGSPPMKPTLPALHQGSGGSSHMRAAAPVGRARGRRRSRHQGRVEDGGRRPALHQRDRDRAAARRPRQDGGPRGRRLRVERLSRPHRHRGRPRHRHHQFGRSDVGAGDALGPEDPDRHHRRLLDRLHRSDAPAGRARTARLTNSRIIIYAVRPFHWKDEFPKVNAVSPAYADEVRRKWKGKLNFLSRRPGE